MTHNDLIIEKIERDNYTSRAINLLAAAIGVSKRQVKVGARLMLADAISFLLATFAASALTMVVLLPSDVSVFTLIDARGLPLFLASCLAVGLYNGAGPSPFERLRLRGFAIILFITAMLLLCSLVGSIATKLPGAFILSVLLLPTGFYLEILVRKKLIANGTWGAPTLVVGTDNRANSLFEQLKAQPELGLRPVGKLSVVKEGMTQTRGCDPEEPVDARVSGFENSVEAIVLTCSDQYEWFSSLKGPELAGCRLVFAPYDIEALRSLWLPTRSLGNNVGIEVPRGLQRRRNRWLKRAIDIVIAGPALLLVLPLLAATMIAIKVVNPGPALFKQKRMGLGGRPIQVLKVRSMYLDAEQRLEEYLSANPGAHEEWERFCKLKDDPRVLPGIGKFIRGSSLDEFPQLWNVVRGDMSIVGPRPFPSYHLERFDEQFNRERQSVLPGLTGLWQVTSRSNGDLTLQRAQDLFYIRNWSLWLDFYILLKTPLAVLGGNGAH